MPQGGQLKAKQDGVVRPGASWLSLGGFGEGGNWSITDQAALTPGWGLRDGSHPLDSWIFGANLFPLPSSLNLKLLQFCKTDFSNSVSLKLSSEVINWAIATHDAPGVQRNSRSPQLQGSRGGRR